jgi:cobalt-zinc-cadmium efflux system protein
MQARRALWLALVLNAALLGGEIAGGLAFKSLALLADAVHQGSDVVALGVALVAQTLVTRPGSARHTYGLRRAEALGAQANGVLLVAAAIWIVVESVGRFGSPEAVNGTGVIAVAIAALMVNVGSALLVARVPGRDLNLRGVFLHMSADAAGSIGALAAGIAVLAFNETAVDPAASILIGVLVVVSAWGLLRDTVNVLLEGAPRDVDLGEIEAALVAEPHVEAVHHLHVWELGSDARALSVHVVLDNEPSLHDAQAEGGALKALLAARVGIEHATVELECHDCQSAEGARHDAAAPSGDGTPRPH